jgi:hypothetical protein
MALWNRDIEAYEAIWVRLWSNPTPLSICARLERDGHLYSLSTTAEWMSVPCGEHVVRHVGEGSVWVKWSESVKMHVGRACLYIGTKYNSRQGSLFSDMSHVIVAFSVTRQSSIFSLRQGSLFSDMSPIIIAFSVTHQSSLFNDMSHVIISFY